MLGKLVAFYLLTVSVPAVAQKVPALPGSADLVAQPAFDCASRAPQPIGQDITMQQVTRGEYHECPSTQMGQICMLISLPSGQKILVTGSDTDVIEGKPLEATANQQLQQIGSTTITRCNQARTSPAFPIGTPLGIPMLPPGRTSGTNPQSQVPVR